MKKILCLAVALAVVLGFGFAYAGDARVAEEFRVEYQQRTGQNPDTFIWFPVAPQLGGQGWSNILILSNYARANIQVQCWFTSFSRTQTVKLYDLTQYEKRIFYLEDELGTRDDIYDIFCGSAAMFGAGLLLLENGAIVTAWPPVVFIF